ncbi:MAG: MFS transporter [Candidatus Pacebacteria bacterium]|nr:MFS transporter [Candidatus Paceibacterota bacterium]
MENLYSRLKWSRNRVVNENSKGGFVKLFISKQLIQGSATAILGIFVPIFIYETSGNLFYVVGLYYALLSLLTVLFIIPGMYAVNKIGFSRSLVLGGVFSVILYTMMFFLTPENIWHILGPLAIVITLFRIFHWVPFHVDFALFTKKGQRGKQVSLTFASTAFLGVIGPILAGFIITNAGYDALFGVAVVLLSIATVSYAFVPETMTQFTWSYKETWKKLFSREMRGVAVGEFASGAEIIVNLVVWPIFLYEVLNGDFFEIGIVSTIVVGATIVVQLFMGNKIDKGKDSKEKTLRVGSTLYAFGWILKMFILSAAHVFFIGLYHNIVKIFTRTPFAAILYDLSADQGKYVDEYTVVREISSHSGRVVSLLVISALSLTLPIGWAFLIAAVASIALNLVYRLHNA